MHLGNTYHVCSVTEHVPIILLAISVDLEEISNGLQDLKVSSTHSYMEKRYKGECLEEIRHSRYLFLSRMPSGASNLPSSTILDASHFSFTSYFSKNKRKCAISCLILFSWHFLHERFFCKFFLNLSS